MSSQLCAASLSSRVVLGNTSQLRAKQMPTSKSTTSFYVSAGNSNTNGIFAPVVRVTRNIVGQKPFNQLRGKGIALHSQVITAFCNEVGAETKVRQRLIKTAKLNGGELGFLA